MATTFILFTLVFWSYALNHYFLNKIRSRPLTVQRPNPKKNMEPYAGVD
jgi:hypothetical protein